MSLQATKELQNRNKTDKAWKEGGGGFAVVYAMLNRVAKVCVSDKKKHKSEGKSKGAETQIRLKWFFV